MNGKFVYFAVAALLGALCAFVDFLPFFVLFSLYLFVLSKYKRCRKPQLLAFLTVFSIFLLLGQRAETNGTSVIPEKASNFSIEYLQAPKIDGDLLQVLAADKNYHEKFILRYKIKSEEEQKTLKDTSFLGFSCRVSGTTRKPAAAKNPNGFDYREYLAAKEVYWIVESQGNPLGDCAIVKPSLLVLIKQLRFSGINFLESHFPSEIASLSAALIFGDRNMLDPELLGNYQKTGIVHLLAISGLHVSLLIGMVFYLGIRAGLPRQFMMNLLLMILPVYVILTGASPSVTRASLMIFLVLLTVKWQKHIKLLPIDAISLAFLFFLLFSPLVVFDAGFQLSFSVSIAIILSAPLILTQYQATFSRMLVTSMIAQLAALPILLFHFFEVSLIGIVANLLYIPLFSFVYLPGVYLFYIIQLLFGKTPDLLITLFLKVIYLANLLIDYLAQLDFLRFIPGRPGIVFLILYIVVIFLIFSIWESKPYRRKKIHLIILTSFLVTFQPVWNWINPYGEVTMIDVGQGDSILIHLPHGKGTYLIDTGGTVSFVEEQWRQRAKPFEVGRDVVVPFLKGKGITKIDKLILTHGDMDHIGGTFSILKELEVKQILIPSVAEPSETEIDIIHEAEKKDILVLRVSEGDQWKSGGSEFYVLSPEKNFAGERNSGSIAFITRIGGLSWFFGGDLDQEGEEKIIKKYPKLTIDILKAGHHGSKTSSAEAFINQITPKAALISAGENNRFGHPHNEVLNRLHKTNTVIYRTDLQGAITYRFFRGNGTFSTFLP